MVEVANGPEMDIQGNILDMSTVLNLVEKRLQRSQKKWFRIRDTYGVEMSPDMTML